MAKPDFSKKIFFFQKFAFGTPKVGFFQVRIPLGDQTFFWENLVWPFWTVSNGLAFYSAYWGPKKSHCRHPYLRQFIFSIFWKKILPCWRVDPFDVWQRKVISQGWLWNRKRRLFQAKLEQQSKFCQYHLFCLSAEDQQIPWLCLIVPVLLQKINN